MTTYEDILRAAHADAGGVYVSNIVEDTGERIETVSPAVETLVTANVLRRLQDQSLRPLAHVLARSLELLHDRGFDPKAPLPGEVEAREPSVVTVQSPGFGSCPKCEIAIELPPAAVDRYCAQCGAWLSVPAA
ncbi:MAG: hypothetical protein ABSE49_34775 [Polyangiaceae bacterium]|jgi:hypothetical protein